MARPGKKPTSARGAGTFLFYPAIRARATATPAPREDVMDRKIILLALIGAVGGVALGIWRSPERKGKAAQEMFPPEKLAGYVQGTRISLVDAGKATGSVIAWAVTPYGLRPDQVSPTGYGALKALRKQHPEAKRISVFIAEDSAMAEASNWVGLAEFRDGAVKLTGGFPTQAQLDSVAGTGQPLRRPTPEDLKVAAAVFFATGGLRSERWSLARTLIGAAGHIDKSRFASLDLETAVLHSVAKSMGRQPKEVQATVTGVTRYYWLRAGDPL